mgnify:CR=1 FL=1
MGTGEDQIGTDGDPRRPHSASQGSAPGESRGKKSTGSRTTGQRKRRVKVTPKDWEDLEEMSERLGVGYSKVYRIAFQKLLRDSSR